MVIRMVVLAGFFGLLLQGAPEDLGRARKLYNHTDYLGAVEILTPVAAGDADAEELLGQSFYMLGDYKRATEHFEKAIVLDGSRSDYHHWLGRTYGRRAETAFPLAAPGYASKARTSFERAIHLDPGNSEAVNDLFEYYLEAPGFLGGGFDKAAKLADQIAERDQAEGNFAKARLAEERKDFGSAEALLRRAMELAPQQPGRILDLAKFLAKQGRYEESDNAFQRAHRVAPDTPKVLYAEAATYIKCHRKQEEARKLLERYLALNLSPEDVSRSEARKLLRQAAGS